MAKKEITNEKDINLFNKVIERIGISKFYLETNYTICVNEKDDFILVFELEENLKNHINLNYDILNNDELKKRINIIMNVLKTDNWIKIDPSYEMHLSKIFSIDIDDCIYSIDINRDQMPFKLLKSEYDSIYYTYNKNILLIKKEYKSKLDGYGFSVIRGFQFV